MPRIDPEYLEKLTLTKVVDGPKYDARVQHLKPEYRLKTTCGICGAVGLVDSVTLHMRFKPYERMKYVEQKLKCDNCGNRHCCSWDIVKVEFH